MELVQLSLLPEQRQLDPHAFEKRKCPFANQYQGFVPQKISWAGRYLYWDYLTHRYRFSPFLLRLTFYKPASGGPLEYVFCRDDLPAFAKQQKERYRELGRQVVAQAAVPARKPRQPYRWSQAAKARNRRNRLLKRIQKKHGFDPKRPPLFADTLQAAIQKEFDATVKDNPYYTGVDIDLYA